MMLLTKQIREQLIANHHAHSKAAGLGQTFDPKPVVKLFTPWANATWLFTELDPETELLFGLCDLGLGFPELGDVSLAELSELRGIAGLKVERDRHFKPQYTLSDYAKRASEARYIAA